MTAEDIFKCAFKILVGAKRPQATHCTQCIAKHNVIASVKAGLHSVVEYKCKEINCTKCLEHTKEKLKHNIVACLEHLYTAIELNRNYTDSALELIGEFCCITGNQEELDEYRRRAIELSQRSEDETSDGIDDGKLHPHTLSEEKLNTIIEYIKSVDEKEDVVKVYCFDQVNSKNFRETVFVLRFKNSDTESAEAVYTKVFKLLDTDPDGIDYSLYVYSPQNAKKIDALKGAEVFNRS